MLINFVAIVPVLHLLEFVAIQEWLKQFVMKCLLKGFTNVICLFTIKSIVCLPFAVGIKSCAPCIPCPSCPPLSINCGICGDCGNPKPIGIPLVIDTPPGVPPILRLSDAARCKFCKLPNGGIC